MNSSFLLFLSASVSRVLSVLCASDFVKEKTTANKMALINTKRCRSKFKGFYTYKWQGGQTGRRIITMSVALFGTLMENNSSIVSCEINLLYLSIYSPFVRESCIIYFYAIILQPVLILKRNILLNKSK